MSSKKCDFGDKEETLIRDVFVTNMINLVIIMIILVPAQSQWNRSSDSGLFSSAFFSYYSPHFILFFLWAALLFFGDYGHFFASKTFTSFLKRELTLNRIWPCHHYGFGSKKIQQQTQTPNTYSDFAQRWGYKFTSKWPSIELLLRTSNPVPAHQRWIVRTIVFSSQ